MNLLLAVLPLLAVSAPDTLRLDIEVVAATAECRLAPMKLDIVLDREPPASWTAAQTLVASLIDADGATTTGQIERDTAAPRLLRLRWLEPQLHIAQRRRWRVEIGPTYTAAGFTLHEDGGNFEVRENNTPACRWMTRFDPEQLEETKKVYLHVYDPHGTTLLTNGAGGRYPHHRGVYVGWRLTRVGDQTWDTWHMPNGTNTQRFAGWDPAAPPVAGPLFARQTALVDWHAPDGRIYARDHRTVTTYAARDVGRLFDIELELRALGETVNFDGDPHHGGLQFRAANAVAESSGERSTFIYPAVAPGPEPFLELAYPDDSVHGLDPRWVCMTFELNKTRYGALYMSHPATKPAATFSVRYYGRFGEFFPCRATPDQPLRMRYGLLVFEGRHTPEMLESIYQGYVAPPAARLLEQRWAARAYSDCGCEQLIAHLPSKHSRTDVYTPVHPQAHCNR